VNCTSVRSVAWWRVYTLFPAFLAVLLCAGASPVRAQDAAAGLTVEPTMAKGAAGAPVTIIEFSDYQ
jgi:hypothetical protein